MAGSSKGLATSLGFTELSTPADVNDNFKNKNGTYETVANQFSVVHFGIISVIKSLYTHVCSGFPC